MLITVADNGEIRYDSTAAKNKNGIEECKSPKSNVTLFIILVEAWKYNIPSISEYSI